MKDPDFDDSFQLKNPSSGEVVETVSAKYLWQKILDLRMQTGEPYLVFIDTANRAMPKWLSDKGLKINGSNLCTEIFLPTNEKRTAVCCLSSLNLEYYDDWKDDKQFILDVMEMLDNVLQYFIDKAPSTIATDVRGAIKTALAGCTANIYDSVPEAPIVPAIVVVPDAPYMELPISISNLPANINGGSFAGFVEGWTMRSTLSGLSITLNLSSKEFSSFTLNWNQAGASLQWTGVNATLTWANATGALT